MPSTLNKLVGGIVGLFIGAPVGAVTMIIGIYDYFYHDTSSVSAAIFNTINAILMTPLILTLGTLRGLAAGAYDGAIIGSETGISPEMITRYTESFDEFMGPLGKKWYSKLSTEVSQESVALKKEITEIVQMPEEQVDKQQLANLVTKKQAFEYKVKRCEKMEDNLYSGMSYPSPVAAHKLDKKITLAFDVLYKTHKLDGNETDAGLAIPANKTSYGQALKQINATGSNDIRVVTTNHNDGIQKSAPLIATAKKLSFAECITGFFSKFFTRQPSAGNNNSIVDAHDDRYPLIKTSTTYTKQ